MTNEILTVKNLCKEYVTQSERLLVLKGLNLSVKKGEQVCVIGESGNGKSTLLNILGGIDAATSGSILAGGREISKMGQDELTEYRAKFVGLVF
ncbi:MAG: ATP-binding cassette domain-containing protein, partial [Treponema sp.]|nr:ATP-binding cassette domain-containing protein [Treponema sp.]